MPGRVYVNGCLVEREQAHVPLYDHGFLYGDGVFEGIRVYNRRIFKLDEHVKRLYHSALALAIEMPAPPERMRAAIIETVQDNGLESGYIRVSVSRGVGLGLDPTHIRAEANVYISTEQLRLYPHEAYERGLHVVTCSTRVPPAVCIDPQIKSLGRYINNILAKLEANRVGAGEGLMLNMEGYVAEATGDNLFLVRDGRLVTPPSSQGALPGITRATVIDCARAAGIEVAEQAVTLYDCYTADEAFLTGTAAEVIPMVVLDQRRIADGEPGPLTRQLTEAFHARTATDGAAI